MWSWIVDTATAEAGRYVVLTDAEKVVLAHVAAAGEDGMTIFELKDVQGRADSWRWSAHEAAQSIGRFGLVTERYPHGKVRNAGRVVWLSEAGIERFAALRAVADRFRPCCEFMITLPCVCMYKSYCPNHAGGCHGSHD